MARHAKTASGAWRYSGAHDKWPVEPGDVWVFDTGLARHWFACGDLEGVTPLSALLDKLTPTLVYVDPPYNAGLARGYRTKAGVDNGPGRKVDIHSLWEAVLRPAKHFGLVAYVETGQGQQAALEAAINAMGGQVGAAWEITYYRDKPASLVAADFRARPSFDYPEFTGLDDEDTPTVALSRHPRGLVLDPCAGRGLTARAAFMQDWESLSHELSPYRTAEAINHFHRLTGIEPIKENQ